MAEFLGGPANPYSSPGPLSADDLGKPWYRLLTRYHWFVLLVASLGWMFDCLDQQLFILARMPAMRELLAGTGRDPTQWSTIATSVFLIGWASGGLAFGVLGDRIGRARTMLLTILLYSICTGLSAFSVTFWDFALFRFLTGLGVGGEFAVGVALVAEVMPERARPFALGLLQALSAVGNVSAAVIGITLFSVQWSGWDVFGTRLTAWRLMFLVGMIPALLALLIRRRLKEPERWTKVAGGTADHKSLGSYRELFGDPRWRRRALGGMVLAASGVIGLWAIGFYSFDLNREIFQNYYKNQARTAGDDQADRRLVAALVADPSKIDLISDSKSIDAFKDKIQPADLIGAEADPKGASLLYSAARELHRGNKPVSIAAVLEHLDKADLEHGRTAQTAKEHKRREEYLSGKLGQGTSTAGANQPSDKEIHEQIDRIVERSKQLSWRLMLWAGISSIMFNCGACLGVYLFSYVAQWLGRRPTFALCFLAAMFSTASAFAFTSSATITIGSVTLFRDVFWLVPIMGFCQLSLFGGYAVYFPELFPTRLRSTGTSFCYNVGRFVACSGPLVLGQLTSVAFKDAAEPLRGAGLSMCSIFLVGLAVLPFLPETKGQPLPE
ncbi:MAG TPA: MFS transporter [Pirellulales bacterium]|nr:MFS transporter [Pirellulales bacterium]